MTRSESLLGTVQYMAPELTRGAKFATEQSDQYAIGVMLFECATGRRPFSGDSQYELMHAIVTAPVVAPSSIDRLIPPEFDAIVLRAMARDPVNRFPSVHALGRALHPLGSETARKLWEREFWQTGEPDLWSAAPPTRCDEPVATQRRRKPALPRRAALQLAAVGVGVAAASAVWSAWRQPEPSHQAFLGALAASQAGASQPKAAPVEHAEPGPPPPPSVGKTDPSSRRGEILNGAEESEPKPRLSPAAAWVSPPRADPVGPKPPSDAQGKKTDRAGLHPASSQPARSSPQLGTNGALIID